MHPQLVESGGRALQLRRQWQGKCTVLRLTWEVANMRGLASSRQPCSGPGSEWAQGASPSGAGAAAASAAAAALLAATSLARKVRQSLSALTAGSVSGMAEPSPCCSGSSSGSSGPEPPPAAARQARLWRRLTRGCSVIQRRGVEGGEGRVLRSLEERLPRPKGG